MTTATMSKQNSLNTLSSVLFLSIDEVHFFTSIQKYFMDHMNCHQVVVYKILDNGQAIQMPNGIELQKNEGAAGYIARTKRGYFSNTVERDPVFAMEALQGIKAELCLPIAAEGKVIGSIHCQMKDNSREFTRDDMTMGMSVLNEIKGPIQNMKLYLTAKHLNETLLKTIELKERELQESRSGLKIHDTFKINEKEIIGRSLQMKELLSLVDKISDLDITALLQGEAATGKEMIARRIHCRSNRRDRAFVAIDCSAFSAHQLEIELFGNEKQVGMLEAAHYGTVFINNIDLITVELQNKLIQYMNTKMGIKSLSKDFFTSDVRILSASSKDLLALTTTKHFREDLYFALSAVVLKVPALRERKEDIELLANFFLNRNKEKSAHKSFSAAAVKSLSDYSWLGNVRELQNIVERAYILSEGSIVDKLHLDNNIQNAETKNVAITAVVEKKAEYVALTLSELEKNHIMQTLENLTGNKTKSAKLLGITVKTLYNKLHSYGIEFDKEA